MFSVGAVQYDVGAAGVAVLEAFLYGRAGAGWVLDGADAGDFVVGVGRARHFSCVRGIFAESMDGDFHAGVCGVVDGVAATDDFAEGGAYFEELFVADDGGAAVAGGAFGDELLDYVGRDWCGVYFDGAVDGLVFFEGARGVGKGASRRNSRRRKTTI